MTPQPAPDALKELIAKWRDNYGWKMDARAAFEIAADELEELLAGQAGADPVPLRTPAKHDD